MKGGRRPLGSGRSWAKPGPARTWGARGGGLRPSWSVFGEWRLHTAWCSPPGTVTRAPHIPALHSVGCPAPHPSPLSETPDARGTAASQRLSAVDEMTKQGGSVSLRLCPLWPTAVPNMARAKISDLVAPARSIRLVRGDAEQGAGLPERAWAGCLYYKPHSRIWSSCLRSTRGSHAAKGVKKKEKKKVTLGCPVHSF